MGPCFPATGDEGSHMLLPMPLDLIFSHSVGPSTIAMQILSVREVWVLDNVTCWLSMHIPLLLWYDWLRVALQPVSP